MTGRHSRTVQMQPVTPPVAAPVWPTVEPDDATQPLVELERAAHRKAVAEGALLDEPDRFDWRRLIVGVVVLVVGLAVVIALLLVLSGCTPDGGTPTVPPTAAPTAPAPRPAPEEDEPGFDCHTMGNRVCGPAEVNS